MLNSMKRLLTGVLLLVAPWLSRAETIPTQAFFAGLWVQSVAISPDGRYLSIIVKANGRDAVLVSDRTTPGSIKPVAASKPTEQVSPEWCGWANDTRLLCGFHGVSAANGEFYPFSRLVAVNADGSELKVLQQTALAGSMVLVKVSPQFQDRIIDWTPDDPNTVLMELDDDLDGFPDVMAVDVYTGKRRTVEFQHPPIRSFRTDGRGNVRLGSGYKDQDRYFFARLDGEKTWRQLSRTTAFSRDDDPFRPVAIPAGSSMAYGFRKQGDRTALWRVDLRDQVEPEVVFSHPAVDVSNALLTPDRRLLGVRYETDKPAIFYTDEKVAAYARLLDTYLPDTLNSIIGVTRDERFYIIRASSDVTPPSFYVLSASDGKLSLERIGSAYPELVGKPLAGMRPIRYAARDGTMIPGYLTTPVGLPEKNLPLVVLPHGGPVLRDSWGFDPWVQFLAAQGYAVLQMNFRGSSGYGSEWYWSAHQDWGGVTDADITDATRWAIGQGIADPKRICMVGASFGGYAALLAATRHSDLYRCTVSIAGISDLQELLYDRGRFIGASIARGQMSADPARLKADSPRRHVEGVGIPVLMIHGEKDYVVEADQTSLMAAALKRAGKQHRVVMLANADHSLSSDEDRRKLFAELQAFLAENLQTR